MSLDANPLVLSLFAIAALCLPAAASTQTNGDAIRVRANYYQQFDADYSRQYPGEAYGGWKKTGIEISATHTAVVVMHAWDCGTLEEFPGVWKSVEYIPRSIEISRTVFPPLLAAVRKSRLPLFHVVGGGDYYKACPGYQHALKLAAEAAPPPVQVPVDPLLSQLQQFKANKVWRGERNNADGGRLGEKLDFLPEARPLDEEGVAEDTAQLLALCLERGINHLIYTGFAVDACLLMSPGGMMEMSSHGVMCSVVRQATTAVENRETARRQLGKEIGLWRVAVNFGFVFDAADLQAALASPPALE